MCDYVHRSKPTVLSPESGGVVRFSKPDFVEGAIAGLFVALLVGILANAASERTDKLEQNSKCRHGPPEIKQGFSPNPEINMGAVGFE